MRSIIAFSLHISNFKTMPAVLLIYRKNSFFSPWKEKISLLPACLPQRPFCVRSRNLIGSANILFYTPCHLPTLLHLLLRALQRLICFSWIVTDCCQNILAKFFQANVMFNYRGSHFMTVSVCSSPSSNTFEWSWVVSTILEWTYKSYIWDAFYVRWIFSVLIYKYYATLINKKPSVLLFVFK